MNLNLNTDETSALSDALLLVEEVSPAGTPMTEQVRRGILLLKRLEGVRATLAAPEEAPPEPIVELAAPVESRRSVRPASAPASESKP